MVLAKPDVLTPFTLYPYNLLLLHPFYQPYSNLILLLIVIYGTWLSTSTIFIPYSRYQNIDLTDTWLT